MWATIVQVWAWACGTKAGRIAAAIATGLAGLLFLRAKWRSDGAAEQRAEQAREAVKVQEKINEAAADYRADGATRRMRDGSY